MIFYRGVICHSLCIQGNRFEDQRSAPPRVPGLTIPDEDFFNMIVRLQSHRLEDQRSSDPM